MQLARPGVPRALPAPGDQRPPDAAARVPRHRLGRAGGRTTASRCSASPCTSSTRASTPARSSPSARSSCRARRDADAVRAALHPLEHDVLTDVVRLIARGAVGSTRHPAGSSCRWRSVRCGRMTQPGDVRVRRALLSVSDKRGDRRLRARPGRARHRARLHRRHRAGADRGGPRGPRDRGLHRLPRDHGRARQDAPSRSSTRACSRCATTRSTCSPPSSTEIEFVDLVCVNLYPFERTAAQRGATDHEVIENIDIGGPTMIRAAAKNFGFTAVVTRPEMYDAVLQELDRRRRQAVARHARVARRRGVLLHRALRHRDRALVRREAGGLPAGDDVGVREGHRPRVRREPAPARRLLRPGRRAHARAVDGQAGRGQGPLVQQRARPRTRGACSSRSSTSPPARSSSTTTRAAWRSAAPAARPTSARSRATRSRRSAASSASTVRSTASSPS